MSIDTVIMSSLLDSSREQVNIQSSRHVVFIKTFLKHFVKLNEYHLRWSPFQVKCRPK